jgi:hypothetical protein
MKNLNQGSQWLWKEVNEASTKYRSRSPLPEQPVQMEFIIMVFIKKYFLTIAPFFFINSVGAIVLSWQDLSNGAPYL